MYIFEISSSEKNVWLKLNWRSVVLVFGLVTCLVSVGVKSS